MPNSRSILSYQDELWQIPWGEKDSIAAIREEMKRAVQAGSWQGTQAPPSAGYQRPQLKTTGFMMTRIQGTQCILPTVVFSTPASGQFPAPAAPVKAQGVPAAANTSSSDDANKPNDDIESAEAFDGELPSIGSEGHFDGSCKRCAFFPKGRCLNGKDCTHCHFTHEKRSRPNRKRASRTSLSSPRDDEQAESSESAARCLNEVLSYLSEPAEKVRGARSDHASRSGSEAGEAAETPQKQGSAKQEATKMGEDKKLLAVASLNDAILKVSQSFKDDSDLHNADKATEDDTSTNSDADEAASSSFVDSEEANLADTSKKCIFSDTSDSEMTSARRSSNLRRASNSWSAIQTSRKASGLHEDDTAEIARAAKSLLNKLTESRFESICRQILALPVATAEQLAVLVAEIFERATTQDHFRGLYTELCIRLHAHFSAESSIVDGKAFRKALVDECQATFERNLRPHDPSLFDGLVGEGLFEAEMKLKTRRLGNMRFIGELLVRRLLAPKLLPPIVHELLNRDEAALESVIALLSIVAPEFEMKASPYQAPLRDAFGVLRQKMTSKSVCPRVRCQINDLLDAKAKGWTSTKSTA